CATTPPPWSGSRATSSASCARPRSSSSSRRSADEVTRRRGSVRLWYRPTVPIDLGRRLIASGIVSPVEVEAALFLAVVRGVPFSRALIDRGAISERALEEELGRRDGLALRTVSGNPELMGRLPAAMCRRLGAVPTRIDASSGAVDVAAAD